MKKSLIERFQELAGIKSLYEELTTYLNPNWIDIENKYRNKRVFSDEWGFGDFEYDRPNARVYWHLDSNAMGNVYDNDKDFYYDLKTKDFVMDKSVRQNYWHVLPPEDKAIWKDIKNIIDKNIEEK